RTQLPVADFRGDGSGLPHAIDCSIIRAHQHAAGGRKGAWTYAVVWLALSLGPTRPYPSTQSIANTPPCSVVDAVFKAAVRRRRT
ncbi:hypothetical protein ACCT19_37640, partial [Rhizobium ruizarguesonis]